MYRKSIRRGALVGILLVSVCAAALSVLPNWRPVHARQGCDFQILSGEASALRNAINSANENADETMICLEGDLTYYYAIFAGNGWNALPGITTPITISGQAVERVTISGDGEKPIRLFHVARSGSLTLQHVILTDGAEDYGGALYVAGKLTLIDSEIVNSSAYRGGGLYVAPGGLAVLDGSLVAGNHAEDRGGGLYLDQGSAYLRGGTRVSLNDAGFAGGGLASGPGGALFGESQTLIDFNEAVEAGGGIFAGNGSYTAINHAAIMNNRASSGGGVLFYDFTAHGDIHTTCITGNAESGVRLPDTYTDVNLQENWWGAPDGPSGDGGGSGDRVYSLQYWLYQPYLPEPAPACGGLPRFTLTPHATITPSFSPSPTQTPSTTPSITPTMTKHPSLTPYPTDTPTPSPTSTRTPSRTPSPIPSSTATPSCALVTLKAVELVGDTLRLTVHNANPIQPVFVTRADVQWFPYYMRYPSMYLDTMRINGGVPFWRGPDYTNDTDVDSTDPGWNEGVWPDYSERRIYPDNDGIVEIKFGNGPASLSTYYTLGDFNDTTLYFGTDWGGGNQACSVTISGYLPTTPTITPSIGPTLNCSNAHYALQFQGFEQNGVVHYTVYNRSPLLVYVTVVHFRWIHTPSAAPLDFIAVGGMTAFDPDAVVIWDGTDTDGVTTANSQGGGDPGWKVMAALEPGTATNLWLDFDSTTGRLDWDLGYTAADFEASSLILYNICEILHSDAPPPTHTPTVTATLSPTPTPSITRTPNRTLTLPSGCVSLGDAAGTILCTQ